MIAYFDTSALIPLIVVEPGSERAAAVWTAAERVLTSAVTYAEARAALAAASRGGRLTGGELRRAVGLLDRFDTALDHVGVTPELIQHAGDLADAHALRGYDAVHLASVMAIEAPDLVLVAGDRTLLTAARDVGLPTVPTLVP